MTLRRIAVGLVALAAGAGLVGTVAPTASAAPGSAVAAVRAADPAGTVKALYSAKGFQALIDSVTAQVQAQYPGAQLVFVDSRAAAPTTRITDFTRWQFVYNATVGTRATIVFADVTLPSWTASISTDEGVFSGVYPITQPVGVSPFQASVRLRAAGFRGTVESIALYRNTPDRNAFYWFDANAGIVDSVTGEVVYVG